MLTDSEIRDFESKGYMVVKGAFKRSSIDEAITWVWNRLESEGIHRRDPSTWPYKAKFDEIWSRSDGDPWRSILSSSLLSEKIAGIVGKGIDEFGAGWWMLTFPGYSEEPWDTDGAWHIDGHWFNRYLFTKEHTLTLVILFSDVLPCGGGTAVAEGSHLVAAQLLSQTGMKGCTSKELARQVLDEQIPFNIVELTGSAGDVIILHPLLLHARSKNLAPINEAGVRIMCHPVVPARHPLSLNQCYSELSVLERSIVNPLLAMLEGVEVQCRGNDTMGYLNTTGADSSAALAHYDDEKEQLDFAVEDVIVTADTATTPIAYVVVGDSGDATTATATAATADATHRTAAATATAADATHRNADATADATHRTAATATAATADATHRTAAATAADATTDATHHTATAATATATADATHRNADATADATHRNAAATADATADATTTATTAAATADATATATTADAAATADATHHAATTADATTDVTHHTATADASTRRTATTTTAATVDAATSTAATTTDATYVSADATTASSADDHAATDVAAVTAATTVDATTNYVTAATAAANADATTDATTDAVDNFDDRKIDCACATPTSTSATASTAAATEEHTYYDGCGEEHTRHESSAVATTELVVGINASYLLYYTEDEWDRFISRISGGSSRKNAIVPDDDGAVSCSSSESTNYHCTDTYHIGILDSCCTTSNQEERTRTCFSGTWLERVVDPIACSEFARRKRKRDNINHYGARQYYDDDNHHRHDHDHHEKEHNDNDTEQDDDNDDDEEYYYTTKYVQETPEMTHESSPATSSSRDDENAAGCVGGGRSEKCRESFSNTAVAAAVNSRCGNNNDNNSLSKKKKKRVRFDTWSAESSSSTTCRNHNHNQQQQQERRANDEGGVREEEEEEEHNHNDDDGDYNDTDNGVAVDSDAEQIAAVMGFVGFKQSRRFYW